MTHGPAPRDVAPVLGLHVNVLVNGWMELAAPGSPDRLLCDASETAMWVSLSRAGWIVGDAALELARAWAVEPWQLRDRMYAWLDQLAAFGIVRRRADLEGC